MNRTMNLDVAANVSVVRYAPRCVLDRHEHDDASVSVVLAGAIEEEVGGQTEVARLGSIVAKPAGVEHRNRVGGDGAILLAVKGVATEQVMSRGWRWSRSSVAATVGLQLARQLKAGAAVDIEQLIELVGFAVGSQEEKRVNPAWLDQIRSRLSLEDATVSVTELAELAGVHPVYLARAFRKRFGCSIREYRRRNRVGRAAELLARGNLPVAAIAAHLDFFDQSHLCRDFKAELNVSPSAYRAIIRS
jgi:AraC family transcriptional regulator